MKVEVNLPTKSEPTSFPKLMIDLNDNMIILATGQSQAGEYCGIVLDSGTGLNSSRFPVGLIVDEDSLFYEGGFVDFVGSVTISN